MLNNDDVNQGNNIDTNETDNTSNESIVDSDESLVTQNSDNDDIETDDIDNTEDDHEDSQEPSNPLEDSLKDFDETKVDTDTNIQNQNKQGQSQAQQQAQQINYALQLDKELIKEELEITEMQNVIKHSRELHRNMSPSDKGYEEIRVSILECASQLRDKKEEFQRKYYQKQYEEQQRQHQNASVYQHWDNWLGKTYSNLKDDPENRRIILTTANILAQQPEYKNASGEFLVKVAAKKELERAKRLLMRQTPSSKIRNTVAAMGQPNSTAANKTTNDDATISRFKKNPLYKDAVSAFEISNKRKPTLADLQKLAKKYK